MSDVAIRVEGLGKRYRIGARQARYRTLRETIVDFAGAPLRRLTSSLRRGRQAPEENTIWALKDLSFDVKQGEVVGIIGRNGAGKSTLLKVLSRITKPTQGRVTIAGRVGSLLEVGTGFHPELTGRENIYLNGAILGMRRADIDRKFDEIVAFAEIEAFLDTPVKHYSTGMYMRLAFSVAAHLEPEVLLVDEVLAVGDADFQKKCLGKMGKAAREGRTVLFVSHAMAAVQSLCGRGIVLRDGGIVFDGAVDQAISRYTSHISPGDAQFEFSNVKTGRGSGQIHITAFWLEDATGARATVAMNGKPCTFCVGYEVPEGVEPMNGVAATIAVRNWMGFGVFYHHNLLTAQPFDQVAGSGEFRLHVPRLPLSEGRYIVDLFLSRDRGHTVMDKLEGQASFDVSDGDFFGTGFEYKGAEGAAVLVDGSWQHRENKRGNRISTR